MKVSAQLMYEDGGRPVPKWREALERSKVVHGKFRIADGFQKALNANVRMAYLLQDSGERLELYRAEVLYASDEFMTVTGLERDELHNKFTAQTWLLQILAPK